MTAGAGPRVAAVYDRVAPVYDLYTGPMEAMGGTLARRRLFSRARGRVLELGIGTGANISSYPRDVELVGVDISGRMLQRARRRVRREGRDVVLQQANVEHLPYPDASFDTVTATCVFCSVDDPVQGLREARRVTRPGGLVLLYEHVRPRNPLLAQLADAVSPWTRRTFGPELNRRTEENVAAAGMTVVGARRRGIWRELVVMP